MSAKQKLLEIIGPKVFPVWFSGAVFNEKAVIVKNKFIAQKLEERFATPLRLAFGFPPEIKIAEEGDNVPCVQDESKPAQVLPILKARRRKIGFAARELILMNLPHSDPKAPVWIRKNGNKALIVQGGYKYNPQKGEAVFCGVPYGPKARLILFYLMTEAKLTNSPRIHLGNSFNSFLEAIGSNKNSGGKDSGRDAVRKQIQRILTASFSVSETLDTEEADLMSGSKRHAFTGEYSLWFSKKADQQLSLWESYIDLSPEFFDSIQKAAIPLDWDILLQLKNSALAIDLYALLTFEASRAAMSGTGRFIPFAAIQNQLGGGYASVKEFSRAARGKLAEIKKLYPALKLGTRAGGLDILPESLPSVERSTRAPV